MAHLQDGDGADAGKPHMAVDDCTTELVVKEEQQEQEKEEEEEDTKKLEQGKQGGSGSSDQNRARSTLLEGKILSIAQEISAPILVIDSPPLPPSKLDHLPLQRTRSMCILPTRSTMAEPSLDFCCNTSNGNSASSRGSRSVDHHYPHYQQTLVKNEAEDLVTATNNHIQDISGAGAPSVANSLPSSSSSPPPASSSPAGILTRTSSYGLDIKKQKKKNGNHNSISHINPNSNSTLADRIPSSCSSAMTASSNNYLLKCGSAMTDDQVETLRRQISVYSTICNQLVEMHKALMAQHAFLPNMHMIGNGQQYHPNHNQQATSFDSLGGLGRTVSGRQRWTPSQLQLQILENLFKRSNGTPSKQKIKAIAAQLGQHGSISESNVYNWFQNRKARAKRKQQHKDGESEVELEEMEVVVRKDKRVASETIMCNQDQSNNNNNHVGYIVGKSSMSNYTSSSSIIIQNDISFAAPVDGSSHMVTEASPEDSNNNNNNNNSNNSNNGRDDPALYGQGLLLKRNERELSSIVVFIDGKPWEVPSTTLDLRGSFGDGLALLDSHRRVVPTDENGFTTCPLHAGEAYTLIKFNNLS